MVLLVLFICLVLAVKGTILGVKLLMVKRMKINLNLTRAVLWFATVVVMLFVWLFIVFCVCGILMSVF